MTMIKAIIGILGLFCCCNIFAQAELSGTWQGQLETSPGAEMTVQFIVSADEDGEYSALINSPESGALKNIPADSANVNGNELSLEFTSLSGKFNGTLANGELSGDWQQLTDSFPLVLSIYEKPLLSAEQVEYIVGSWVGKVVVPGLEIPMVFHFESNDSNEISGSFDSPLENAFGIPVSNLEFTGSALSLNIDLAGVRYIAEVSEQGIDGVWQQQGQELPLNLVKGEYEAEVFALTLEESVQEQLLGTWSGQLDVEPETLTLTFRFEKNDVNDFVAFVDIPGQGAMGLAIGEANIDGSTLTFSLATLPAVYTAELKDGVLEGSWVLAGMNDPLTITKQ